MKAVTLNKLPSSRTSCECPACTQLSENGGDESSAAPHGSVGEGDEDDSPNDGNSLACIPGCSETELQRIAYSYRQQSLYCTVAGGSTTWVEAPGGGTFTPEVHIIVRSNISGDVETVLETFPGLHFPVTRSTTGTEGSCWQSTRAAPLV